VSLESAKLALLGTALAIFVFIDGTGGDLGLMHVQTDYPLMESRQFHLSSVLDRVRLEAAVRELREPEGDKPRGLLNVRSLECKGLRISSGGRSGRG
jgi:hypothetical protein